MNGYPQRRVRAMLGGEVVLDPIRALYLWEWPFYNEKLDVVIDGHRQPRPKTHFFSS